jgi:class 3 adenylate cyclase
MPWPDLSKLRNIAPQPFPPFGKLLREQRTLRGMSLEEVAEAVHVSPAALGEMERGARSAPSGSLAKSLADLFQLTGDERDLFLDSAEWGSSMMGHLLAKKSEHQPLPAAILVFLIADIRGYTRFTQEHGDAAAARLTSRFADIARAVIDQGGGQLVEVRGDEVLLVFASAEQAVRVAHDLQARCLQESQANEDLPLDIGIGLDVGEAVEVEGGYRGTVINRAARLCSLARAGEVLVSTGVAYLAPQVEGYTFEPRGQEQLKGFAAPTLILAAAPLKTIEATLTPVSSEHLARGNQDEPQEDPGKWESSPESARQD